MAKKRTSLDTLTLQSEEPVQAIVEKLPKAANLEPEKTTIKQTAYLPMPVHEQLRRLAFEERAKMHDYLMEGLDLVFARRGLPSINELKSKTLGTERNSQP